MRAKKITPIINILEKYFWTGTQQEITVGHSCVYYLSFEI